MASRHLFIPAAMAALSLAIAPGLAWPQTAAPTAKTRQGVVSGLSDDGVVVFRGIPFAAPPVGTLRWRAPQPAAGWTGVRDGSKPGATCFQAMDCLYLNVHAPAGAKPGAKLSAITALTEVRNIQNAVGFAVC